MQRRNFLQAVLAAVGARAFEGCDRLVVIGADEDASIDPISGNDEFYEYQCCRVPEIDPATHTVHIKHGELELASFDLNFLRTLDPVEVERTLQCIGSGPRIQNINNALWTGLTLDEVLAALGVTVPEGAIGVSLIGQDEYFAWLELASLNDGPIWVMWGMNGEDLPLRHGAPARLLVPGRYGVKNLKWIKEIVFTDERGPSYWTQRGWSDQARYRPNTLIASPLDGFIVGAEQRTRLIGTAFAGEDPVVACRFRVDQGEWQDAELLYAPGPGIWALWSVDVVLSEGTHAVQVQCETASGARSDEDPENTSRTSGYGGSMQVMLEAV